MGFGFVVLVAQGAPGAEPAGARPAAVTSAVQNRQASPQLRSMPLFHRRRRRDRLAHPPTGSRGGPRPGYAAARQAAPAIGFLAPAHARRLAHWWRAGPAGFHDGADPADSSDRPVTDFAPIPPSCDHFASIYTEPIPCHGFRCAGAHPDVPPSSRGRFAGSAHSTYAGRLRDRA